MTTVIRMQKKGSLTQCGPLFISIEPVTIHVSTPGEEQVDTLYIYGCPLTDTATVVIDDESDNVITRQGIRMPCFGPILLANGVSRNGGVAIRCRCEHGSAAVFGTFVRSSCQNSVAMNANIITNHLVLAHETLSTGRAICDISAYIPLTFLHASESVESILRLGSARIGTMKHIVLLHQCSSKAVCRVVPFHTKIPTDALKRSQREIVLSKEGETVSLVSTGDTWVCVYKL